MFSLLSILDLPMESKSKIWWLDAYISSEKNGVDQNPKGGVDISILIPKTQFSTKCKLTNLTAKSHHGNCLVITQDVETTQDVQSFI